MSPLLSPQGPPIGSLREQSIYVSTGTMETSIDPYSRRLQLTLILPSVMTTVNRLQSKGGGSTASSSPRKRGPNNRLICVGGGGEEKRLLARDLHHPKDGGIRRCRTCFKFTVKATSPNRKGLSVHRR